MVNKKRKSKRVKLQQKYKVIKRVQTHHKRLKKGVLSVKGTGSHAAAPAEPPFHSTAFHNHATNTHRTCAGNGKKKTDDNRIPNAWPYKEELLKEIQNAKIKMEEQRQRQKEKRHEEAMKRRLGGKRSAAAEMDEDEDDEDADGKNRLSEPNTDIYDENEEGVFQDSSIDMKSSNLGQNSRRAYLRELRKVVSNSDIILQVLDARDPLGTRSKAVEEMVTGHAPNKKLVYVLNKADLVPREVLAAWLQHLRGSHPSVPFKCNTQTQKGNLGHQGGRVQSQQEGALQTSQAIGAEELISLLKNYARTGPSASDAKTIIAVGIVGFPNVGKSSLINSLMRTRAVGVSSMPGFTKVSQEVILDKNIRLIDSPGIVFADGDSAATALRNCVNVEELVDVLTPIQAILERCPQNYLMQLYSVPKFKPQDCMSFLALVAKATGKLKKGGIPNTDAAARSVLHDWNSGKIKYYCKAPVVTTTTNSSDANSAEAKILTKFSKDFDLDSAEMKVLDAIEAAVSTEEAAMDVSEGKAQRPGGASGYGYVGMDSVAGGSLNVDLDDNDDTNTVNTKTTNKSRVSKVAQKKVIFDDEVSKPAVDVRRQQKQDKKKKDKRARKAVADEDGAADYDFDMDYK